MGNDYPTLYLSGNVAGVVGFFRADDVGQSRVRINHDALQPGGASPVVGARRVYRRSYVCTHGRGIMYGDRR